MTQTWTWVGSIKAGLSGKATAVGGVSPKQTPGLGGKVAFHGKEGSSSVPSPPGPGLPALDPGVLRKTGRAKQVFLAWNIHTYQ